mgnify:CR=1 FL=1
MKRNTETSNAEDDSCFGGEARKGPGEGELKEEEEEEEEKRESGLLLD